MQKRKLQLHYNKQKNLRGVIKTEHGRIIYLELIKKNDRCVIHKCYYLDRTCAGVYYSAPKKLVTREFDYSELLQVVGRELDRRYCAAELDNSLIELSDEQFIQYKLNDLKRGYKFLIFVGDGELINGVPAVIITRLKNRVHRSIYLEMRYMKGRGGITDCRYYDRSYKQRTEVIPEPLTTVFFKYNRQTILNIINQELNTAFTDIIFVNDGSIDINNEQPLCGCI